MAKKLFRTFATSLTDDELTLLDVMFENVVVPSMLRQCNIYNQFLTTHSLGDLALSESIERFLREGIAKPLDSIFRSQRCLAITEHGAALWSSERCPVWERYCVDREFAVVGDQTLVSVRAVTPKIREEYLQIAHSNPTRVKRTTIRDNGLLPWRSFDCLYVGLVSFTKPKWHPSDDLQPWLEYRQGELARVERQRTWWRDIGELQKFSNPSSAP
jgi:hypothetical protein